MTWIEQESRTCSGFLVVEVQHGRFCAMDAGNENEANTMKFFATVYFVFLILVAATTVRAEPSLATQTSNDIGVSLSSYRYQEPGIMSNQGNKLGLDMRFTKVLQEGAYLRGDLRYAFGSVDYSGSGSASGQQDWYVEGRGLVGKDWVVNDSVLSPYTGLGYRYLFNDARGFTSTGAAGYRRESNYLYLPIGIVHRIALQEQSRLVTEFEYDHLLKGKQVSRLSDAGFGLSDATNNQSSGYGLRLSFKYEQDKWAVGPYAYYWSIARSDAALVYRNGVLYGFGAEPKNNTVEFGLQASQHF